MEPKKVRRSKHSVVSFRVSQEDADWIENAIKTQLDRLNAQLLSDEAPFTKGQLFCEMVRLALPLVRIERAHPPKSA